MRLALAGLIIAIACTAPAAAQPSPAAIRAEIEDIARTPRDQLTTAQRQKAQVLLEQLYQLEVVAPGPPPKPFSSAASEMLLDDNFDDICAFGLDYYNDRKNLAWAFGSEYFDERDSFIMGEGADKLRRMLSSEELAELESKAPLEQIVSEYGFGDISLRRFGDNSKTILIDVVEGTMKCHSLTLLDFRPNSPVTISSSGPAGCFFSGFELKRFHNAYYVFPVIRTPGEIWILKFTPSFNNRACTLRGRAVVLNSTPACRGPICQAVINQGEKLINSPDDMLVGEKLSREALLALDMPWMGDEKAWMDAYSLDIDNDGIPEIFMRQRVDYGALDYKIAKKGGNAYVPYRATNWDLIDGLNDDYGPLVRRFAGNQGLNFIRLNNQTYIVVITYNQGVEGLYDLTIFQAKGYALRRIGTIVVDTKIKVTPSKSQ